MKDSSISWVLKYINHVVAQEKTHAKLQRTLKMFQAYKPSILSTVKGFTEIQRQDFKSVYEDLSILQFINHNFRWRENGGLSKKTELDHKLSSHSFMKC